MATVKLVLYHGGIVSDEGAFGKAVYEVVLFVHKENYIRA